MAQLRLVRTFVEVARTGSFTLAARNLHISRSSVSKQVRMLERELGVPLLMRSTHHVAPTQAGMVLLEGGVRLLRNYEHLEGDVRAGSRDLRGQLTVGVPPAFGAHHLIPAVHAFTALHADVNVSLRLDDGNLDLVRDGLDISLRIAPELKDASYVSRILAKVPQCLVAAPEYLTVHGMPKALDDLRRHNCLVHSLKSPTGIWTFGEGAGSVGVPVTGSIRSNFGSALHMATLLGAGISMHPFYMVSADIEQGRLRVVLPDGPRPVGLSIHAIYVNRNIPRLVRTFLEFLVEHFADGFEPLPIDRTGPGVK